MVRFAVAVQDKWLTSLREPRKSHMEAPWPSMDPHLLPMEAPRTNKNNLIAGRELSIMEGALEPCLSLRDEGASSLGFSRPSYLLWLPSAKLVLSQASSPTLLLLSSTARRSRQPKHAPVLHAPSGLACDENCLYVADQSTHRILRLQLPSLEPLGEVGVAGDGWCELTCPQGLAIWENELFVSDSHNHRVVKYHPQLLEQIGQPIGREGGGEGEFCYPHGLTVISIGPSSKLVVADTHNHRVQILELDGTFSHTFGCHGSMPGQLDEPVGCALDV